MFPNMSWLCKEMLSYTLILVDYLQLTVYLIFVETDYNTNRLDIKIRNLAVNIELKNQISPTRNKRQNYSLVYFNI
jgi:hypothetical protein